MAKSYQTPGVYNEEISKLPPSVKQVETAMPVFIGYTGKKEIKRVTSLTDYEAYFGQNSLYPYLQLYFANGGGNCYIITAGEDPAGITAENLMAGLAIAATYDEPSLTVIPQVHLLPSLADAIHVYQAALQQAADLRDRFVLLDCYNDDPASIRDASLTANLSYGAAYHPFLLLKPGILPPAAAMAGVYAKTDAVMGVWHSPANVSLNAVSGLTHTINDNDQEVLNIDALTGKSINALRAFVWKGILVWGARTLAGNDNDWRYISVRRFMIMIEGSAKKAIQNFVTEPNDANTWAKIQSMLENFLTLQWRAGALQGTKPVDAFYVAIGLNRTMTSADILGGRLIIEMGLAAVRPSEFIIIRITQFIPQS